MFEQVRELLAPYANVILLFPSPDKDESVRILNTRENIISDEQRDVNEHFIRHHLNYDLAKFIVYTHGKTSEETCAEIINWIREIK